MDLTDRLAGRLLEVLERGGADPADRPLTIGEVYQQLIPYRQVRSDLGIHELAAYEHALLRLLAGEGGHWLVNRADVREEVERELASPNPILGIYRDYAAEGLRLNPVPPAAPAPATPAPPATPLPPPPVPAPLGPAEADTVPRERHTPGAAERASVPPPPALPPPPPPPAVPPPACRSCRMHLPPGKEVRFCPFCGAIQGPVPCKECGVDVQPDWSYCIGCGLQRTLPGKRA